MNSRRLLRLELLHQLKPEERSIAFLVNRTNPSYAEAETREMQLAANVLGVDLVVLNASSTSEIEAAFLTLVQRHAGAILIGGDIFFVSRTDQLIRWRPAMRSLQRTRTSNKRWRAVLSPPKLAVRSILSWRTKKLLRQGCATLKASTSAVRQADRLRGAAHPVVNIRTSEHYVPSRPSLNVRMFGS